MHTGIGRFVLAGLAAVLAGACGSGSSGGALPCTSGGVCPAGYACTPNGICAPSGSGGSGGNIGTDGGSGSGGSSGVAGGAGGDPTAAGAQPPANPNAPPSPSTGFTVLAFNRLLLGDATRQFISDPTAWRHYGYNLDGILSTENGTNHCSPVPGASSSVKIDGVDGIDNSYGANIVPMLTSLQGNPSEHISDSIAQGDFTLLWRLANYSAGMDDSDIQAGLYVGAALSFPPSWNGNDVWPVTAESVVSGNLDQPKLVATESYVVSGTLVSRFPQLHVDGFLFPLPISNAVLTVQITGNGANATGVSGTIAGVLPTEVIVSQFQQIAGSYDTSLCDSSNFEAIATELRQASDIMADGTNGDPSQQCDGISIGLGFDASAVQLGWVAPPATAPGAPCTP